jgi:hypothetical protein
LFEDPRISCLGPGEEFHFEVQLTSWWHRLGRQQGKKLDFAEQGPYGFALPPGRYRIQAVYKTWASRQRSRCPMPRIEAYSEWISFKIPDK